MKLLAIQLVLFVSLVITLVTGYLQYSWIPVTLMIIPALLLTALACNWPILGLWAAFIEFKKLGIILIDHKLHVDNNYTTNNKSTVRIVHVKKCKGMYKAWFLDIGPYIIHPITQYNPQQ